MAAGAALFAMLDILLCHAQQEINLNLINLAQQLVHPSGVQMDFVRTAARTDVHALKTCETVSASAILFPFSLNFFSKKKKRLQNNKNT
jgi:uncharacterized protein YihD (DUF1040 family)